MRRIFFVGLFFTLSICLFAQINKFGVPFVENYPTQITGGSEQFWCITEDVFGNIWFGNQDRGLSRYDGTSWTNIPIKDNPRMFALESDDRGIIFVAAAFEFGYVQPDINGGYEYISLSERIDSTEKILYVYSILIENNVVHFLSPKKIYNYDIQNDELTVIDISSMGLTDAHRMVKIGNKMIIADSSTGFSEFDGETVKILPNSDLVKGKFYTVLLPYSDNEILVTPYGERAFLYDLRNGEIDYSFINADLNAVFAEEAVYAGVLMSDGFMAISTTVGGVYVVDKNGELVQHISTENNILLDNSVYAMYCDYRNNSELWIATYGYISKASFNLPITKFEITENINEIAEFNGNIYLATDAGIVRMYTDELGEAKFSDILPGTADQIFPLQVITTDQGEILLAGGISTGVMQIDKNLKVRMLYDNIANASEAENIRFTPRKILPSKIHPGVIYFGNDPDGFTAYRFENGKWYFIANYKNIVTAAVSGMLENNDGSIWVTTTDPTKVVKVANPLNKDGEVEYTEYGADKGVKDVRVLSISMIGESVYITTTTGLLRYDAGSDMFVGGDSITGGYSEGVYSQGIFTDNDGDLWYNGQKEKTYFDMIFYQGKNEVSNYSGVLNLLPNAPSLGYLVVGDKIYLTKTKTITVVDKKKIIDEKVSPKTYFVNIVVGNDTIMNGQFFTSIDENRRVPTIKNPNTSIPEFRFDKNKILFEWTTPYFTEEFSTEYSYILEGYESEWSPWEGISFGNKSGSTYAFYANKQYENLPYGRYKFRVKGRTVTGIESEEVSYEFEILKPWYVTSLAIIIWVLLGGAIVMGIIAIYTKRLKEENIRLEGIVAERTAVVVKQKEELESSIHYASRIQFALLPSKAILDENLKNNFILFRPRDIVSGDYYWMSRKGDRLYVVAADCTGHGVPGAFMSLLGMSFLEEIVGRNVNPPANLILNQMRQHVIESLKQVGRENEAKDGMDMGILVFDFKNKKVEFSGAYNPCFRVRKMTKEERVQFEREPESLPQGSMANGRYYMDVIEANKMPIGISLRMEDDFELHTEELLPGVAYYMSSDGYIDQFGGDSGKKFMKKNFKKLLLDIQDYPMSEQRDQLEQRLIAWMGPIAQIDDIIVLGVKTE